MSHCAKAVLTALVALLLVPAGATAVSSKALPIDEGGDATFILDGKLRRTLDAAGIEVEPLRPAHRLEKTILLPAKGEGGFELRFGTGYAFLRGGLRLRGDGHSVAIRHLVLNTAKKRLSGKIGGRTLTLAATDEVKAYRTGLGLLVKVGSLRLTARAAELIGAKLRRPDLFRPHRLLGRLSLAAPLFTVPVTKGTIDFSLDEGFVRKLTDLGVSIVPGGSTTLLNAAPLTFSFGNLGGEIDPEFEHGRVIVTGEDSLRLVQANTSPPREVIWRAIGVNFENGYGTEGSDVVVASWGLPLGLAADPPLGQVEFGTSPSFDGKGGFFTSPRTPATLSPYAVKPLDDAFAGGKAVFTAGEPLGSFSFVAFVE
ncbi:MAG TPA: hypothetical protein VFY75_06095 [Solirubrobacterales bacterium]|nr:hypothetical protein [Solirubrobacterales bacterium]